MSSTVMAGFAWCLYYKNCHHKVMCLC